MFDKPYDLDKIVSIETYDGDTDDINGGYSCDLVYDVEKVSMIKRSHLSSPTEQYPVALVFDKIEVIPDTTSSIKLTYYRRPSSRFSVTIGNAVAGAVDRGTPPRYAVTTSSAGTGLVLLNTKECRNFDLPQDYYPDLVNEIASMMGVRLRDPLVSAFAAQQQAQA